MKLLYIIYQYTKNYIGVVLHLYCIIKILRVIQKSENKSIASDINNDTADTTPVI